MQKYKVTFTVSYDVEAQDNTEAIDIAVDNLIGEIDLIHVSDLFQNPECTIISQQ